MGKVVREHVHNVTSHVHVPMERMHRAELTEVECNSTPCEGSFVALSNSVEWVLYEGAILLSVQRRRQDNLEMRGVMLDRLQSSQNLVRSTVRCLKCADLRSIAQRPLRVHAYSQTAGGSGFE